MTHTTTSPFRGTVNRAMLIVAIVLILVGGLGIYHFYGHNHMVPGLILAVTFLPRRKDHENGRDIFRACQRKLKDTKENREVETHGYGNLW